VAPREPQPPALNRRRDRHGRDLEHQSGADPLEQRDPPRVPCAPPAPMVEMLGFVPPWPSAMVYGPPK
jgi:hypothetical protein